MREPNPKNSRLHRGLFFLPPLVPLLGGLFLLDLKILLGLLQAILQLGGGVAGGQKPGAHLPAVLVRQADQALLQVLAFPGAGVQGLRQGQGLLAGVGQGWRRKSIVLSTLSFAFLLVHFY